MSPWDDSSTVINRLLIETALQCQRFRSQFSSSLSREVRIATQLPKVHEPVDCLSKNNLCKLRSPRIT